MAHGRIYLDNAATSFPKPSRVTDAMVRFAEDLGASPGRGSYRESLDAGRLVTRCRERMARLVGLGEPSHVVFTLNATDALNQAIKGIVRARAGRPVHAISTEMDHNSILRPLNALQREGLDWTSVRCDPRTGLVDPDDVRRAVRPETALVAIGHASNVTGTIQDLAPISRICREVDVLLVVDAAQTAGHVPIEGEFDVLCVPGHKGLLGPLGTGGMVVRPGIEDRIAPLREGGTGSVSELDTQPREMPDRYESGSQNTIGIAGLSEGVAWILERGVEALRAHDREITGLLLDRLRAIDPVRVLAPDAPRVGVVSIVHESIDPHTLAMLLEQEAGVLARAGLHCAPYAHRALGTLETGALRLSAGPFTTLEDVSRAVDAIDSITADATC